MLDRREEVLNSEYTKWVAEKGIGSIYPPNFPAAYRDAAINAMDENGKRMCLDLLEHMAKNRIVCGIYSSADGELFKHKGRYLTKEQLFENFL
jgi:hypothetical protein